MFASDKKTVSRRALYDMVWSRAVTKLAKEFGLSDVGFSKLCKRNEIPRPMRGYWAMKEVGKAPPQTLLPRPQDDWDIDITPHRVEILNPVLKEEVGKAAEKTEVKITVADTLHGAHRLASESFHVLNHAETDPSGFLICPKGCLCLKVSKPCLRRGLLIMDALLKAFESKGYAVSCGDKANDSTLVEIFGSHVAFGIDESLEPRKEELPDDDKEDLSGRYVFHHSRFETKRVPSGKLSLAIDPGRDGLYFGGAGQRLTWKDGKRQRVEDCLDEFVAGAIRFGAYLREEREKSENRERERAEEKRRQEQAEKHRAEMWTLIQAERAKVDGLRKKAADYEESRRLRAYIEAFRQGAIAKGKDAGPDSETGRWLAWAEMQADRMDPFKDALRSILDDEAKYRPADKPKYW